MIKETYILPSKRTASREFFNGRARVENLMKKFLPNLRELSDETRNFDATSTTKDSLEFGEKFLREKKKRRKESIPLPLDRMITRVLSAVCKSPDSPSSSNEVSI